MADIVKCNTSNPRSLPPEYIDAMTAVMKSGQYSDLRLTCKGHEFLVHRIVVCSHSPVLKVACEGEFLEAQTMCIKLDDDDLESLQHLISYMYTLDYQDHGVTSSCDESPAPTPSPDDQGFESRNDQPDLSPESATERETEVEAEAKADELFSSVRVYAIADKYDVVGLKNLARTRFEAWAKVHWMSEHFPAMVSEVFETTPAQDSGLRDVAISIITTNLASVACDPVWYDVISEHGQLGAKLLEKVVGPIVALKQQLRSELVTMRSRVDQLEREKSESVAQLLSLTRRLNNNHDCRHCGSSMNVSIEAPDLTVPRCRGCRTRHF